MKRTHVPCNLEQSRTGERGWAQEMGLTRQDRLLGQSVGPRSGRASDATLLQPTLLPSRTFPSILLSGVAGNWVCGG